jgi:hypothetical protein
LLLDGFDELVQWITYPTAAAYLGTLLEAVTDEAKVVLTSRTQHFSDDRQIRTALLTTRTGREATRIVALEDFSDAQILRFLTRLYQGDQVRAQRRFTRLDEIKELLGLSRTAHAFIAELPDSELDEAQRVGGTIRAADLYRKILDHWLQREVSRQRFRYGHRPLSEDHRRAACRDLALQLWTTREATGEVISPTELTETTAAALTELETLGFSAEQAAHAIGSGSLLTRTSAGFGFVHRSIMEWLVADAMATAVRSGQRSPELAAGEMSELMTDFFCDLAGHSTALSWADGTLCRADGAPDPPCERANATRVRGRLRGCEEATMALDLHGQDLRDQDLAALARADGREGAGSLRHSVLRDTILAGKRLSGLDLTGADLTGADLTRALLTDVDLTGADLTGTTWFRAAVLGGSHDASVNQSAEWQAAAVAGRDPASPVLAAPGSVQTVAYLAQEQLLAVARGSCLELVDLETHRPVRVLTGHTGRVWAVAAVPVPVPVPDGRTLLATGSGDGTVRLWDPVTGTPVSRPLTGHTDTVLAVAALPVPDGRTLLASGSGDRTVRLWDPTTGTPVGRPLTGHTGGVRAMAALPVPDGRRTLLATGSWDRTVRLWDPTTGTPIGEPLTGHTEPVRAVAALPVPDGRTLLASGSDDGTVRLWDPTTGTPIGQPLTGHTGGVRTVAAVPVPDGRTLLASGGDDGTIRLALLDPGPPGRGESAEPDPRIEQVATLVSSQAGDWAALLSDDRSYKGHGDVSDVLWWAIKLCRFEIGQLDPYVPGLRRLPDEATLL